MLQQQHQRALTGLSQAKQCYFTTPLADYRALNQLQSRSPGSERGDTANPQIFGLILHPKNIIFLFLYNCSDLQYIQLVFSIYSNHLDISLYRYIQLLHRREEGEVFE